MKKLLLALILLYVAAAAALYLGQDRLLFHPRALPASYAYDTGEELLLATEDTSTFLSALYLRQRPNQTADRVTLYLHGNRGDNRRGAHQMSGVGGDLLLLDYRGFGKSGGLITSEAQLLEDAQRAYDWLTARYAENAITVVGYSLGTGMASYLAANNAPGRCVLVAPYSSLADAKDRWFWMFPDFLLRYPLDNVRWVPRASCPVTILHGEDDELLPYYMARAIEAAAPDLVELIKLENTGHRGAILHPLTKKVINLPR